MSCGSRSPFQNVNSRIAFNIDNNHFSDFFNLKQAAGEQSIPATVISSKPVDCFFLEVGEYSSVCVFQCSWQRCQCFSKTKTFPPMHRADTQPIETFLPPQVSSMTTKHGSYSDSILIRL